MMTKNWTVHGTPTPLTPHCDDELASKITSVTHPDKKPDNNAAITCKKMKETTQQQCLGGG